MIAGEKFRLINTISTVPCIRDIVLDVAVDSDVESKMNGYAAEYIHVTKVNSIRTIRVRSLCLKHHKIRSASSAILLLSMVLILSRSALPVQKKCTIIIMNGKNQPVILKAELALTYRERARGLMFRKKLGANEGMLFVFATAHHRNFWMKNTLLPLSIAYISKYGIINEIYDMKPLDTSRTYPSLRPAQYALEVNRGWFRRNNIKKGCKVLLNGCIGQ